MCILLNGFTRSQKNLIAKKMVKKIYFDIKKSLHVAYKTGCDLIFKALCLVLPPLLTNFVANFSTESRNVCGGICIANSANIICHDFDLIWYTTMTIFHRFIRKNENNIGLSDFHKVRKLN